MGSAPSNASEYPIILFPEQKDWSEWLGEHHSSRRGVWLRLAKKKSSLTSLSYAEAVETALCYGWIDGQKNRYDCIIALK